MGSKLIGRDEEKETLKVFLQSKRSEFLAIYGRRRVGKTFLVRTFFETKKVVFLIRLDLKMHPYRNSSLTLYKELGQFSIKARH